MSIVFIEDFTPDQVPGGGEKNNAVLRQLLVEEGLQVKFCYSKNATVEYVKHLHNKGEVFIIGNFIMLRQDVKDWLTENATYSIYEHDHKYLKTRDPSPWRANVFKVPESELINLDFYKNARAVFCQSRLHSEIVKKNVDAKVINLGGNLWSDEDFDIMASCGRKERLLTTEYDVAILNSRNVIKGTPKAIKFAKHKELSYDLIPFLPFEKLCHRMLNSRSYLFFSSVVETLNRVACEARMINLGVITEKMMVGCFHEDWFREMRGLCLLNYLRNCKRDEIVNKVMYGGEV